MCRTSFTPVGRSLRLRRCPPARAGGRAAVTLIEMLIVITALAVIAGVMLPELDSAVADARYSAMLHTLNEVSLAIERYRIDHNGRPPALQSGSLPQLLSKTNAAGTVGTAAAHRYGPYLPSPFPENPLNHSRTVTRTTVAPPPNLEEQVGWVYHTGTGQIWAGLYEGYRSEEAGGSGPVSGGS